ERLAVEALAFANGAGDPNIRQEVHLQLGCAVSLARLTAAAGPVEAESARRIAANLGIRQLGEVGAYLVEHFDVGSRVRSGRAADRRLVDVDDLVDVLGPGNPVAADADDLGRFLQSLLVRSFALVRLTVRSIAEPGKKDFVDERTLSRAADASDADEHS